MEDNFNQKWKTTSPINGRRPHQKGKTTSPKIKDDLTQNGRRLQVNPKWKTIQNEDEIKQRRPKMKMTKMKMTKNEDDQK